MGAFPLLPIKSSSANDRSVCRTVCAESAQHCRSDATGGDREMFVDGCLAALSMCMWSAHVTNGRVVRTTHCIELVKCGRIWISVSNVAYMMLGKHQANCHLRGPAYQSIEIGIQERLDIMGNAR